MLHAGRRTFASALTVCATLFAAAQAQNAPAPPTSATQPAAMPAPQADPAAQSTPPAAQAPAPDSADETLRRMDRDGDGQVSADEHAADARARFDAMDADRNYNVSAEEAAEAKEDEAEPADNGAMGAAPDPNNNGELSKSEADANAERDFRTLDVDRDGTLDVEELKRASKP